jgi:glyoxylate reductase
VTDRIDAEDIAAAGDALGLIANYGTGVDHINLAATHGRDITGTNTPDVLTEDTVNISMALIPTVTRRLSEGERLMRVGE